MVRERRYDTGELNAAYCSYSKYYLRVVDDFIRDVDSVVREVSPRLVRHRDLNNNSLDKIFLNNNQMDA